MDALMAPEKYMGKHMRTNTAIALRDDQGDMRAGIGTKNTHYGTEALTRIVMENLHKIEAMARRMARTPDLHDDLISVGVEGMLKSLPNYTPIPGVPFFAYATKFVRSAMQREALFPARLVNIPDLRLRNAQNGLLDDEEAAFVFEARFVADIDSVHDEAPSATPVTAEILMMNGEQADCARKLLDLAIASLSDQEAEIIRARFLQDVSAEDLAIRLDISAAKMRKIEHRAKSRMKSFLLKRGVTADFMNMEN